MSNTEQLVAWAEKADRLGRTARVQDLSLLLAQSETDRITRVAAVLSKLDRGAYLIGTGPYTQGVYSVMCEEVVLGRLATPLESPLDKPVDIFCQDIACLTPREVSRYHAQITRIGDTICTYTVKDLGSTCGTFLNGKRVESETELSAGDVISLGPSHVNTYIFVQLSE